MFRRTLGGTGSGVGDDYICPGAARGDRPGQPVSDGSDCRADLAALPGAAPSVRNHPPDVPRPWEHGGLPHSDDRHHDTRSQPLGVRPTVDSGPEQRGRDRCGLPVDRAAAAAADDDAGPHDRSRSPNARTPIRHHRDRRLGRDDGGPPGRLVARLSRSTPDRGECSPGRRPQRVAALPRDDGDPRQGRGRRAARASSGHGLEPVAVARTGAAAVAKQAAARHRGGHDQHAAHDVARRQAPRIKRSSRERATRFERGVSPEEPSAQGGHHAPRSACSCSVRRSFGRELRADQRLRPGRHGQEHARPPP